MKYLLLLFFFSLGFHNLVNAQIMYDVPNYLFADDAKIGVNLMFGVMDKRITKSGSVYNKTLYFVLQDLKKLGLEPVFHRLQSEVTMNVLDEPKVTPNVWLTFMFFKYPKRGDVKRKDLAKVSLLIQKVPAASEKGTVPLTYAVGNRSGAPALTYIQLFEKLDQYIKQAGPSYFVNKIDDANNEVLIPNTDTVNYFPKDLDKEKLVICRFTPRDYYRFNNVTTIDQALANFKKKYPFEILDCEILKYELKSLEEENIKYLLRTRTYIGYSGGERKAFLVYYIKDLQTGVNYVGKIVANSDSYGATRTFCKAVKEQFDIK
ncbi:MAG: hypothetical protein JKY52_06785 [Flavobacteriales bacterium]|nr:hypothetical protein [Flavobacteriales bacterium]